MAAGGEYIFPSLGLTENENKEAGEDGALEDDRRAAYRHICRRAAADSGTDMTYRFADEWRLLWPTALSQRPGFQAD